MTEQTILDSSPSISPPTQEGPDHPSPIAPHRIAPDPAPKVNFWRSVFSDNDTGSFSRVGCGIVIAFDCLWISYLLFKGQPAVPPAVGKLHFIPDLGGLAGFNSVILGFLYGANRIGSAVSSFGNKP